MTEPTYYAYYQRFFGLLRPDQVQTGWLNFTHRLVKPVRAESLDAVFAQMQSEIWSPQGQARPLIERLHLSHTSMSIGDVARSPNDHFWVCNIRGWTLLERPVQQPANPPLWMSTEANFQGNRPEITRLKVSVDPDCLPPDAYTVERFAWLPFEELVVLAGLVEAQLGWQVCLDFGAQFYETE